jgi:hypothetical protein
VNDKPPEPQSVMALESAQFFDAEGQLVQGQPPNPATIKISKGSGG